MEGKKLRKRGKEGKFHNSEEEKKRENKEALYERLNILKLARLSKTSNFRKIFLDLLAMLETFKIIEKYFGVSKTFQHLSNLRKVILNLLAIQETLRNHGKIF